MTGAMTAVVAEKGIPVRIRSSPATVSGAQASMSLTQVGKTLWAAKLSQETCLLRSLKSTGDRLAFARVNLIKQRSFVAPFTESPAVSGVFLLEGR